MLYGVADRCEHAGDRIDLATDGGGLGPNLQT